MKKYLLLLMIGAQCFNYGFAQSHTTKTMHAGESIAAESRYLFPEFTNAVVKLNNGSSINSKMNFNLLICEMQFINANNDTLVLSKPQEIDSIFLDSSVFFFKNGFYQILASANSVKLVVLRVASYEPVKIGALGLESHSSAGIQSYTSIDTYAGTKNLVVNEDININMQTVYFLMKPDGEMIKANKSAFIKMYPQKETSIQTYLKQNRVDFNKEADLKKLFAVAVE